MSKSPTPSPSTVYAEMYKEEQRRKRKAEADRIAALERVAEAAQAYADNQCGGVGHREDHEALVAALAELNRHSGATEPTDPGQV